MTKESQIKFVISLSDQNLDDEELETTAQNILREFNELDAVERANLVATEKAPTGSKAIAGFALGVVEAIVDIGNIKGFTDFLSDLFGTQPIEMEVEANGRKLKLKANSQSDLITAIRAGEDFIEPD